MTYRGVLIDNRYFGKERRFSPALDRIGINLPAGSSCKDTLPDALARLKPSLRIKSIVRVVVMHVCFALLAITNIVNGILIANEHYARLPAPLVLSIVLSIFYALLTEIDKTERMRPSSSLTEYLP